MSQGSTPFRCILAARRGAGPVPCTAATTLTLGTAVGAQGARGGRDTVIGQRTPSRFSEAATGVTRMRLTLMPPSRARSQATLPTTPDRPHAVVPLAAPADAGQRTMGPVGSRVQVPEEKA